jgi:hypothetical protein
VCPPLPDWQTVWLEDEAGGYRMSAGVVTEPDGTRKIAATFTDYRAAPVEPMEVEAAIGRPSRVSNPSLAHCSGTARYGHSAPARWACHRARPVRRRSAGGVTSRAWSWGGDGRRLRSGAVG